MLKSEQLKPKTEGEKEATHRKILPPGRAPISFKQAVFLI